MQHFAKKRRIITIIIASVLIIAMIVPLLMYAFK